MSEPRIEAQQGAAWWASRLGHAVHDIGGRTADEREKSANANLATMFKGKTFTPEQVDAFRRELAVTIEEHLCRWETGVHEGSWRPEESQWGSALRAFGCDYNPERILTEAAERAGFKIGGLDLPMKTVMWVNPGEVKVAEGYSAPIEVVWQARDSASEAPRPEEP